MVLQDEFPAVDVLLFSSTFPDIKTKQPGCDWDFAHLVTLPLLRQPSSDRVNLEGGAEKEKKWKPQRYNSFITAHIYQKHVYE